MLNLRIYVLRYLKFTDEVKDGIWYFFVFFRNERSQAFIFYSDNDCELNCRNLPVDL